MAPEFDSECFICKVNRGTTPMYQSQHWAVNLAEEQGYLGHSYVHLRMHKPSLGDVTAEEWADLLGLIKRYEHAYRNAYKAQVFNWVCLMNDAFKLPDPQPHVHWEVRPRYDHPVIVGGVEFVDPNFAHHYDKSRDRDHLAPAGSRLRGDIESAVKRYL